MKGIFAYDGPYMQTIQKALNFLHLNLLVLLFSLPVVTAGAAITAAFRVVRILKKEDVKVTAAYWKAFRENFKEATLIFTLLLIVPVLLFLALSFSPRQWSNTASILVLTGMTLGMIALVWALPLQAGFSNHVLGTILNGLLLAIGHLPTTFLLVLCGLFPFVLLVVNPYLIVFDMLFGIVLPVYWSAKLCGRVFRKFESSPENRELT